MTTAVRMSRSRPPSPVPATPPVAPTTPGLVLRSTVGPSMAGSLTSEPAQPLGTLYAYTPEQPLPPRLSLDASGMSLYRDTLDGFIRNMQAQVAELRESILEEREARNPRKWSIHSEREARKVVDQKLVTLGAELKACKKRFVNYQALPDMDLRKALDRIESRGHIHIDIGKDPGQVYLLHPITFVRRTAGDAPTAAFSHPELANAICSDLAEAARLFDCSVAVEGHTKGGEGEFWQVLANNRARLVAEKINSFGVDSDKITCQGLPGRLGLNDSCTVVRLGIQGYARQLVQNIPHLEGSVLNPISRVPRGAPVVLSNGHTTDLVATGFAESLVSAPSSRAPSPAVSRMVSPAVTSTSPTTATSTIDVRYLEGMQAPGSGVQPPAISMQPAITTPVLGSSMSVPFIETRTQTLSPSGSTPAVRTPSVVHVPRVPATEVESHRKQAALIDQQREALLKEQQLLAARLANLDNDRLQLEREQAIHRVSNATPRAVSSPRTAGFARTALSAR